MASASDAIEEKFDLTGADVGHLRHAINWRIEHMKENLDGITSVMMTNNLSHKRQELTEILKRLDTYMSKIEEIEQLCHETL